jgi:hypothetical protein
MWINQPIKYMIIIILLRKYIRYTSGGEDFVASLEVESDGPITLVLFSLELLKIEDY